MKCGNLSKLGHLLDTTFELLSTLKSKIVYELQISNFLTHLYSFFGEGKGTRGRSPMRWTHQTRVNADTNITHHTQRKIEEDGEN